MKKAETELTEEQKERLDALILLSEDQIDTSDIPDTVGNPKIIRGMFYHPEKLEIQLVLDDFVIDWFKDNSGGKQDFHEQVNGVLLEYIRQCRIRERREAEARIIRQAMERIENKKRAQPELSEEEIAELDAELDRLASLPDDRIDTSDIPDTVGNPKIIRGMFYRPVKQEIQLVLDDFVIDWFKENSGGTQDIHEHVNGVLLEHIRQCRIRERREAEARIIRQAEEQASGR